jgi:adenine phosphoribosyltransferase
MDYYELKINDLARKLPKVKISDNLTIASFVILGDTKLIEKSADLLFKKMPQKIDYIICPEAKSIPLAHAISVRKNVDYIVLRKSVKGYMNDYIEQEVSSITTIEKQKLVIDSEDVKKIKNKNVAIIDDVVSTGGSIEAVEKLLKKVEANIVWKGAILLEGEKEFKDLIYLEKLPLWYN